MKYFFILSGLALLAAGVVRAQTANFTNGDLVRLAGSPAVYYVRDGKRFAFPNDRIFKSWYENFSSVRIVSAGQLASLPLAGNILYRPGSRLVKITTDPRVYFVEPEGRLRWVPVESMASLWFGSDWNKKIDDLPDAFFAGQYQIGPDLSDQRYPSGALVQNADGSSKYLIVMNTGRLEKRPVSDNAFGLNRLDTLVAITDNSGLTGYADGPAVPINAEDLTDASQTKSISPVLRLNVTAMPNPENVATGGRSILGIFRFWALSDLSVGQAAVRLDATSAQANPGSADPGGLIQNLDTPNFSRLALEWTYAGQAKSSSTADLVTGSAAADRSQTLRFNLSLNMKAGDQVTVYLKGDVAQSAPEKEKYKAALLPDQLILSNGLPDQIKGPEIQGNEFSLVAPGISAQAVFAGTYFVKNMMNTPVASFTLTPSVFGGATVKRITFTGFIDANEGDPDFQPGIDYDPSQPFAQLNVLLANFRLYDSKNNLLAGPGDMSADGILNFNLNLPIAKAQSETVTIKADYNNNYFFRANPDRFAFDIVKSQDMDATDQDGHKVQLVNPSPNGADNPVYYLTAKKNGEISIHNDPLVLNTDRYMVLGQKNEKVTGVRISPRYEPFMLKQIAFKGRFPGIRSVERLKLYVNGQFYNETTSLDVYKDMNILITPANPAVIDMVIDVADSSTFGRSDDQIAIDLDLSAFQAQGQSSGELITQDRLKDALFDNTTKPPTITTRQSIVSFSLDPDSPVGYGDRGMTQLLKFTLSNPSSKVAYIKRMNIKIVSDDVANPGTNNDLIERLTNNIQPNGDIDQSVDLILNDDFLHPLAEGASGGITYQVWINKDRVFITPGKDYQSAPEDYGLITYLFLGNGLQIPGNTTMGLKFFLDTSGLTLGPFHVYAEIPGDVFPLDSSSNFAWSDLVISSSGKMIPGLPIVGHVLNFH